MFKRITAFITAAALSIQCLCIGSLPGGNTAITADAAELSSLHIDTTADSEHIASIDVKISDTANKNSFLLNVIATPIGFEGHSIDDPIMQFYNRLVYTHLSEYLVEGEMPEPESLSPEKFSEIMNKAKDAVASDPLLSAQSKFMTYTFKMPKKASVTNEDDSEGTPADVYINCVNHKDIPYIGTSIRMGEYSIVDSDDSYEITISLDNYALWANPDIFNFYVGMNVNADDTDISDIKLGKDGDKIEIDAFVLPIAPPEDKNENADNFRVEKYTTSDNDAETITYTIKAYASNGATLAGKTITDLGPDILAKLDFVSAKKDGISIPMTGDALIYTFPDNSAETTSEFTITYKLKDGNIGNYIQNGGFQVNSRNEVTLTDADNPEIKKSAVAWGNIRRTFMTKQGQPNGSDNKTINWTVTIDTKYVCADNIYFVDYLNNTQTYVKDSLTVNGTPITLSADTTIADSLSALVVNPDGTVSVATDTVLTYGTGDDKTEGFVIKLSDFGNPADLSADGEIKIQYTTKLRDDIDIEAFASQNYGMMKYKNTSELIADKIYYGETNKAEADEYNGEIKREHEISTNVKSFEKQAGTHSPVTQTLTWKLIANSKYGMSCDNSVITDTLPDGLSFADGDILTGIITYEDSSTTTLTFTRIDGTAPSKDSVEEYKYYVDGDTITIGLGEIKEDEKYELTLTTKVDNADFLTTANNWEGGIQVTNTASLHTLYDTTWTMQSAPANAWLSLDSFRKQAYGSYNKETRTASWMISANISCLPIEGLKLTEILPDGMTLVSIDKIEIRDASCLDGWGNNSGNPLATITPTAGVTSYDVNETGDKISWTITDTPGALYGSDTIVFDFNGSGISDNKYEIYLTTKASEEIVEKELGKGTNYNFVNTCTMEGEAYDKPINFTSKATVTSNYKRTEKTGTVVSGMNDTIMWTCVLNQDNVDMGDVWLIDDLEAVGLELILDIDLYPFELSYSGNKITGAELDKFETDLNYTGFSIKIPEDYKDKTLKIVFYTRIVKDVDVVTNKLYIRRDGDEDKEEHSSSNQVDTSKFDFSAGASASSNPKIVINKYDSVTNAILPGVKFKATYTYMGKALTKSATSNEDGTAYLTNLPVDTVITFTEEATVNGYVLFPKKYNVVFLSKTTASEYANNIKCIDTTSNTKPKFEIDVKNRPEGEPAVPEEIILFKSFTDTDLSNMSVAEAQNLLDKTEFTIYSDAACETIVDTASLKWDSERKQAYVSFEGLTTVDTYYYIKETKAAAGFTICDDTFKVFVDENGIVSYEINNNLGDIIPVCINSKADIDDILAQKIYQNTDLSTLSENSRNDIIERTEFMLFTDSACTQAVFADGISPVWNSINNTATITISSGIETGNTYYLKEIKSPGIYKLSDKIIRVVVNNDGSITYFDGETELTAAPVFENKLKQIGPIDLEKIYADTDLSTLSVSERNAILNGTVFTLYKDAECSIIIATASPKWEGGKAVVSFTESLAPDYTYYLKETSAPDGYVKSEKLYKCVIDEDGAVSYFDGNTALNAIVCINDKVTAETTPMPEETTPVPEDTTPAPEDTTPAPEDTTPAPEETTPVPEDTTPVPEDTTPVPEDTTPVPEDTTPVPEDTTPVPEDTTPVPEDTTPVPEDTTPVPEDTTPVPEDTTPAPEDTTPVPEDTTPVPEDTTPVPEDTTPVPEDTTPAPEDTTPAPENTTPVPEDTTPVPEETTPAPEDTTPAPEDTTPVPEDTTPVPEDTTPVPEDTTPVPEDTTPAPEDTTPAPEDTTPVPEDTTPAPEETTPAPEDTTSAPETTPAPETTSNTLTGGDEGFGNDGDDNIGGGDDMNNPNTGNRIAGSAAVIALLSAGIICLTSKRKEK